MRKLILIAQTSVDGYVAGPNGEFTGFIDDPEILNFVCSLNEDADAALFGRISFQLLNNNWPTAGQQPGASEYIVKYSNWYNHVSKYVLSKTLHSSQPENATVISEDIASRINALKKEQGKNILVFGSPTTVHSLIELKLLDSFWLLIHPVMFGQGIELFKNNSVHTKLNLVSTKHFDSGMMGIHYSIAH
jgi:dihydrofolate reductase